MGQLGEGWGLHRRGRGPGPALDVIDATVDSLKGELAAVVALRPLRPGRDGDATGLFRRSSEVGNIEVEHYEMF